MANRWFTQVMTRCSGLLTIYCKNEKQARSNVEKFVESEKSDESLVSFESLSEFPNIIKIDEIVSVSVMNSDTMQEMCKEEIIQRRKIENEVNILPDDYDGDN